MRYNDAIKSSLRGMRQGKMRTALTMLGIVIGVSSVILIMALGASANRYIVDQVESFGSSHLINVQPGAPVMGGAPSSIAGLVVKTLVQRDVDTLRLEPSILVVAPNVNGSSRVVYENRSKNILWVAVTPDTFEIMSLEFAAGHAFTQADDDAYNHVVILGSKIASDLFGDVSAVGKSVRFKDVSFRVVGVLKQKGAGALSMDSYAMIPLSVGQKQLRGIDYFSELNIKIDPTYDQQFVKARVTTILRQNHRITDPTKDDFMVTSMDEAMKTLGNVTSVLTIFLSAIAAISLVVGGIGIMNIMLVSVTERTREIGLRKAIGATDGDIMRQFLVESVILTSIGGFIGIVAGAIFVTLAYLAIVYGAGIAWVFQFPISAVLLAVGVSAATGLGFGVYPALQAARKNPIDALRYE